ncbi:C3H1-type domain-containing protein [Fusarium falciforme]|uniref:C3H1-type domain-containing protein n=1 Tax=Fusarium falciforme TaxID=195108 RepID=UPI002301E64A|nr:C3H1-type domain-containing protein [Fusarium falciforme]WAO95821.1 C3H1-type domain-containing protein [Fusarium falciforme]
MASSDPSPELKGPTVAASANQCLESFQQCLISASSVHPREVSMVEDQLARFSSWATSIGVFAPGSASMDHRLRYASEVQSVVTGLLESLNYRVQTCSKVLTQLAESSTTDVSTTTNDRFGQSFLDIAAEITRLNKISNTIRRASKDTQALKASNFQIKDEEGENVEPLLLSHFEHHIGDWFPGISETIRQRLARAMLLRRKRILYRRHRQGNTSIRSENTISQASVTLPDAQPKAESSLQATSKIKDQKAAMERPAAKVAPSQVRSATTLAPEKFKMVSSSPSVVSASRTIASGKHQVLTYPPAPGFAAKRRYEKLRSQRIVEAAGTTKEPGLRELLESDLQAIGEITCPYCLYALPAAEVFDERKWQNHVKNDLDPYVCLFEDCDQPDILYAHSDEWLGHLHQHGKVWRCSSHREMGPFSTLEDYMKHMRDVHDTKLSDRQLRVVANRNSRKTAKLFPSCPLCGREESEVDGRLEDHLAGHLRSLALKSLPSYQDEIPDDVGDGNNSIDGSRPRSRSTIREMEEEKEEMLREGAGNFWDHWTPQLAQGISVNFLGDVYFELDLGDSEARVASLFFDTMVFKESSENLDDDPILQSMLQQQLARIEVIDAGTDDSSDLSVEQGVATSSKPLMGETSGQDEVDDATPQQPVNVEPSHAQTTPSGQDTEVDIPKEDEMPETLTKPTTQAPLATELEIPGDSGGVNLSSPPMDETSGQDEADNPDAKEPADAEAAHVQTETTGKGAEVIFPEGNKGPKPKPTTQSRPSPEPDFLEFLEGASWPEDFKRRVARLGKGEREAVQRVINARRADAEVVASLKRLEGVDEDDVVNGENAEDRGPVELGDALGFLDKVGNRFRDKPEAYEEFIEILQTYKRERTPIQDTYAQISVLFESAPDLLEDFKQFLPKSAPRTKPHSQMKQDVRPKNEDMLCQNVLIYGHCRDKDQGCKFNHGDGPGSVSRTTRPPGAPSMGSTSLEEKDDHHNRKKKRESGVYINGEKVMDLDHRKRPLTKRQSPSSSPGKAPGGSSSSQIPPRPGSTIDNQGSAASAPQARYANVPVTFHQPVSDGSYYPYTIAESDPLYGNYQSYPIPQSDPFKPPPPPSYLYPDDAFEADVEDDIPRPKNPLRKTRTSGIYVNGKKVRDSNRGNSPVGSRRERVVIVDNPLTPYTTPNALPYTPIGPLPVIVDERPRPRVEIEIIDDSRPRRHRHASDVPSSTRSLKEESTHPRHASDVPRSARSLNDDYEEQEKRRQRRRERRQQEEADERLRVRINKANAEISGHPPVPPEPQRSSPYRRPPVEILDPEADTARAVRWDELEQERRDEEARWRALKKEGKEMEPSAGVFDHEAELVEAVRRLKAEQERYEEEAHRLPQKEDGKGKEKEGEEKRPAVELPNREAELIEAVRRLDIERERRKEKARKEEMEEEEIQQRRLMERMKPRERSSVGSGSRRNRVLYDEGSYRWE